MRVRNVTGNLASICGWNEIRDDALLIALEQQLLGDSIGRVLFK